MIADYIKLRPDRVGWTLIIYTEERVHEFTVGDVIQFTEETERTLGKWLADGPADFHQHEPDEIHDMTESYERDADYWRSINPDLARDLERGK